MQYSVWRPAEAVYDYYEDTLATAAFPVPDHLRGASGKVGLPAEAAGWPLPSDARKTGRGNVARGMIATLGGVESGGGLDWLKALGLGLVGYGLYKLWGKK